MLSTVSWDLCSKRSKYYGGKVPQNFPEQFTRKGWGPLKCQLIKPFKDTRPKPFKLCNGKNGREWSCFPKDLLNIIFTYCANLIFGYFRPPCTMLQCIPRPHQDVCVYRTYVQVQHLGTSLLPSYGSIAELSDNDPSLADESNFSCFHIGTTQHNTGCWQYVHTREGFLFCIFYHNSAIFDEYQTQTA